MIKHIHYLDKGLQYFKTDTSCICISRYYAVFMYWAYPKPLCKTDAKTYDLVS